MLRRVLLVLWVILPAVFCSSQTLIINEVSNGPSGNMEYVEFVVIDNTVVYDCSAPTPPCIDIRGWIFDDNSGYHNSVGIAAGCVRFADDPLWACVPVGTIIVIYNNGDPNTSMPANDLTMADGNCTIVAPVNSTLFETNATTPGAIACSYPATGWTSGGSWSNTLFANSGDCARIVDLNGCEVFSLCWGTANANNQIYFSGSGTDDVWSFTGLDPYNQADWTQGCAGDISACGSNDQTPGAPNNAANATYIGQFNNNCMPITPIVANAVVDNNAGCSCTGEATATGSGSIPGYTYEWFDDLFNPIGQTTATATGLCAGTYNVIITSSIGCPDTAQVTITSAGGVTVAVNSETICDGESTTLNATPSSGGGTYSWSPGGQTTQSITVSPSVTTTYTVSYDLGGCIATADGIVTVTPLTTPTFNPVANVCQGDPAPVLPTTSTNGITGSWVPAVSTATPGTTTYTFTPTAGQCASTTTLDITVAAPVTPTFNPVANVCQGDPAPTLPTTSTNGITGTWSPTVSTASAGTSTYTFIPGAGECATITTLDLTIDPTYSSTENNSVCSGGSYTYPDGTTSTNITVDESHTSNLISVAGCDSIIVTNITVTSAYTTTTDIHICSGTDYTYDDGTTSTNITANESYTSSYVSILGCDSLVTENLIVDPIYNLVENVNACENSTYTYPDGFSETITTSTSHTSNLTTILGCDSIIVTNVTMDAIFNSVVDVNACENSTYTYPDGFSETITASTSHTSNLTTIAGCDSIIVTNVTMDPIYNSVENNMVCNGGSYTYPDGTTSTNITVDESHTSNLTSVAGCDSIIVTNITVTSAYTTTTDIHICSGTDFTYDDGTTSTNITADESYTSTYISVTGCDSLVTENLIVDPIYNLVENVNACENSIYTYPDGFSETITASTSHTSNLTTILGCDSIIMTNVTMDAIYNSVENVNACENSIYTYPDGFSETITASTSHTSNLTTIAGCDSIIVTNVTMDPIYNSVENNTVCNGGSYTYPDGTTSTNITVDESHTSNLTSVAGCDSIIVTIITVTSAYTTTTDIHICSGTDYTYDDGTTSTNITANESYTSSYVSVLGCDSLVTENLIVDPIYNLVENVNACENSIYTYPDGFSETITASTSHTSNLTTILGCDSIIVTNVTMDAIYNSVENVNVCENSIYTYPDGFSETITASTSHTSNLATIAGCDSIIVTNVTMDPIYNIIENISVCENSTIIYPDGSNEQITSSSTHISNLTSVSGCDSIIVTNVMMDPIYNIIENISACENSTVLYPDGTSEQITSNSTHTSNLTSVSGCDSIIVTNVMMDPIYNIIENISACENSTVLFPDGTSEQITSNSTHISNLTSVSGCDSIIITNVEMRPIYSRIDEVTICENEVVTFPNGASQAVTTSMSNVSVFQSQTGCDSIIITNVNVIPAPQASFSSPETTLSTLDTEVQLYNNSTNASSYYWQLGNGFTSNQFEPTVFLPNTESGSYTVVLIAYNTLGCSDTAYLILTVEEELIFYVPNTFTPDDDQFNQTFQAIFTSGYDPYDFTLLIFNRWGEIIWESHDDKVGWDGTYSGYPVQDGTYTWKIEFKTNKNDERKMCIGHVNVIR